MKYYEKIHRVGNTDLKFNNMSATKLLTLSELYFNALSRADVEKLEQMKNTFLENITFKHENGTYLKLKYKDSEIKCEELEENLFLLKQTIDLFVKEVIMLPFTEGGTTTEKE